MLIGAKRQRITQEAQDFLKEKVVCVHEEGYTYIILYGYEGSTLFLLAFVCDRYFVVEVCG